MRLAVVSGRAKAVRGDRATDVSEASEGRFGPSPLHVYDNWDSYCAWAGTASLPAGDAVVPSAADAPVLAPRQIFGIGLNYRAHQVESGFPEPDVPLVFTKFQSSIAGQRGLLLNQRNRRAVEHDRRDEVLTQVGDQSMRHTAVALTPSTQETP